MRYTLRLFLLSALLLCLLSPCAHAEEDVGFDIRYPEFLASADATGKPRVLYRGHASLNLTMRSAPEKGSPGLGWLEKGDNVYIFGFDQYYLYCWDDDAGIYFLNRHNVADIISIVDDAPAYGVMDSAFVAVTAGDTLMRAKPSFDSEPFDKFPADTRISFWLIQDGWAVVPYDRRVGYVYLADLKELTPVAPSGDYARDGDILTAFTTFYSTEYEGLNIGRMENIRVGCTYIMNTYEAGAKIDFNAIAGPYYRSRGYMDSPVLIDGMTKVGSGGGTCQVSTTLYNALLQIPEGITIVYQRSHGPGGAAYAPHGMDSAVGSNSDNINFIFRNDYSFPISIDCTMQNGALCICIRKGQYTSEPIAAVLRDE